MGNKKKISVTIDEEIVKRLEKVTEISGKTLSHFVNYLLKKESERLDKLILKYVNIKERFGGEE